MSYKFTPAQDEVLRALFSGQYIFHHHPGDVRAGKTFVDTLGIMFSAYRDYIPGSLNGISAKTLRSVWNIIIPYMVDHAKELGWRHHIRRSQTDPSITFQTPKGPIKFDIFSAADESSQEKIRGYTVHKWFADELGDAPESFFQMLFTRLSLPTSTLVATQNRMGTRHWTKKLWDEQADNPRVFQRDFRVEDNLQNLGEGYLENQASVLHGAAKERMIGGRWADEEGLIYRQVSSEALVGLQPREPVWVGVDYGGSGVTAAVFITRRTTPGGLQRYELVDEYYHTDDPSNHRTYESHATAIASKYNIGTLQGIAIDHNAADMRHWFSQRTRGTRLANKDVLMGIHTTQQALSTRTLVVSEACANTLDEAAAYIWGPNDKPIKANDHLMDALRYCWVMIAEGGARLLDTTPRDNDRFPEFTSIT